MMPRNIALLASKGAKFNTSRFQGLSKQFGQSKRGFADQPQGERLRAVVFQPETQVKTKKKSDPLAESGIVPVPSLRLKEAVTLTEALNYDVVLSDVVQLKQFYRGSFFGKVKLEEIKQVVEQNKANAMIINYRLKYVQEAKLRELFPNVKIFDRAGIVLELLSQRAQTRNAKLQLELAALKEKKKSIIQLYESDYEPDGNPLMGVPETKWQVQWRAVIERERKVMRELDEMKNQKIEERQQRSQLPVVACVGYTNSGKTAVVNRIAKSDLVSNSQPFSHLEPQAVNFTLPNGTKAVMLDTVGLIGELSDIFYYAVRQTLDDISLADVMVHVRDISHPETEYQKVNAMQTIKRAFLSEHLVGSNHIEVWNKIDLLDKSTLDSKLSDNKVSTAIAPVSAKTGEGIDALSSRIEKVIGQWKKSS